MRSMRRWRWRRLRWRTHFFHLVNSSLLFPESSRSSLAPGTWEIREREHLMSAHTMTTSIHSHPALVIFFSDSVEPPGQICFATLSTKPLNLKYKCWHYLPSHIFQAVPLQSFPGFNKLGLGGNHSNCTKPRSFTVAKEVEGKMRCVDALERGRPQSFL